MCLIHHRIKMTDYPREGRYVTEKRSSSRGIALIPGLWRDDIAAIIHSINLITNDPTHGILPECMQARSEKYDSALVPHHRTYSTEARSYCHEHHSFGVHLRPIFAFRRFPDVRKMIKRYKDPILLQRGNYLPL